MKSTIQSAVIPSLALKVEDREYTIEFVSSIIISEEKIGRSLKTLQDWLSVPTKDIPALLEAACPNITRTLSQRTLRQSVTSSTRGVGRNDVCIVLAAYITTERPALSKSIRRVRSWTHCAAISIKVLVTLAPVPWQLHRLKMANVGRHPTRSREFQR